MPKESENNIKVDFPQPYDAEGNLVVTYNEDTDLVSMPLWYWKAIVRYAVWTTEGVNEDE